MTDKKLKVEVAVDVTGLKGVDDANKAIEGLGKTTGSVGQAAGAGAQGLERLDQTAKGAAGQVGSAAGKLDELGRSLQSAGVDTKALDAEAAALAAELTTGADASAKLAEAQRQLAPAAAQAAKAAAELAKAAQDGGNGLAGLGSNSEQAKERLAGMKLEIAAAGAAAYTIGRALDGAARDASAFEVAMAEVSTLVSDTSGMTAQAQAVKDLTLQYGGGAAEQAKALYQIISAGASAGAEATGLLDQANKLAVGGVTDVKTAADGLTSVMNAYGKEAGTAEQVSDRFFVAMKAGKTTIGELSGSIGQVAPISAQAGVGLGELLAATAALTKGGTSTSESMTQVRAILTAVIQPTKEASDLAEQLGLKFDAQAVQAKGLAGFLEDVRAKTGGNVEKMAGLFGSVEALSGALSLTGKQAESFGTILEDMAGSAGATDEAYGKMSETSAAAGKRFSAALENVSLSAGQALLAFTPLLEAVTKAINVFNGLPESVKAAAAGMGAIALVAGPAVLAVGSVTKSVGLAVDALGLKRAAALALSAPMTSAADASRTLAAGAAATVAPATAAAGATGRLAGAVGLLGNAARALMGPWGLALTAVGAAVGYLGSKFLDAKAAADKADEANQKMLKGSDSPEVTRQIKEAAAATKELAEKAIAAKEAKEKYAEAVKGLAQALEVDLTEALTGLSAKFSQQSGNLDTLVGELDKLQAQGVDSVLVLKQALSGLINTAKTEADFDALNERIVTMGLSSETAGELLEKALDKRVAAAKTAEGLDAIDASVDRLARKFPELSAVIDGAYGAAMSRSKLVINEFDQALKLFGIKTKDQLQSVANELGNSWDVIKDRTDIALREKIKAFDKYRDAAIAANGGVESSQLALERQILQTQAEAAGLGDVFQKSMATAGDATDKTRGKVKELAAEVKQTYSEIFKDQARYQRALKESAAYGPGAGGGLGNLGGSQAARNAAVKGAIKSDFSIDQKEGVIGSVYTPPPDDTDDWEWTADQARPGGYWKMTEAGGARRQAAREAEAEAIRQAYQMAGMQAPGGAAGLSALGLPEQVRRYLDLNAGAYGSALLKAGAAEAVPELAGAEQTRYPAALPQALPAAAADQVDLRRLANGLEALINLMQSNTVLTKRYELVLSTGRGDPMSVYAENEAMARGVLAALENASKVTSRPW